MSNSSNPYRNAVNSRYLKALFYETSRDKDTVLYTLKDTEHLSYPSLYQKYIEMEDLTEYEFANRYLDGWEHWCMLCECSWFKPFVMRWRKELELLHKARALNAIKMTADSGSRASFAANRLLLEGGWKDKPKKGRPSRDDVKKAAKEQAAKEDIVKDDMQMLLENERAKEQSKGLH